MIYYVFTDVGGIKLLYNACAPVRKIIHSFKLVDYLHMQADNPWYNYHIQDRVGLKYLFAGQLFAIAYPVIKIH